MVQLAGGASADQIKLVELEEIAVAVSPFGAAGTVVQDMLAKVVACACGEIGDMP
jgi:hypothetical protein